MRYKLFCYKYLPLFIIFFASGKLNAQLKKSSQKLDSLLVQNTKYTKEDQGKLRILRDVYRNYMLLRNEEMTRIYVNRSLALAKKERLFNEEADIYYDYALFNHGRTNLQKAEELYVSAIKRYEATNNAKMVAGCYLNLGDLYARVPDYAKALAANQNAMSNYLKLNDEVNLASSYTNIADIYQRLNQQKNALLYLQKALDIFLSKKSNRGIAVVYHQIGRAYLSATSIELTKMDLDRTKQLDFALLNLQKALKVAHTLADASVLGPVYQDIGEIYLVKGDRQKAYEFYQQAVNFNKQSENDLDYASSLIAMSQVYEQQRNYDKAEEVLLAALRIGEQKNLLEIQRNAHERLSTIAEKSGDPNKALGYYRSYVAIKDQIFNDDREKEITRRQMQIDFSLKERDYKVKQQLINGELQRQVLLARQQQQQLILRQQQLAIANQEKSLERLRFLQTRADFENQKRMQANSFNQEQLKSKLDKEIRNKQIKMQQADLRFNRNVNIFLGLLAGFLFTAALFVYFTQRKTARLNRIVSEQKAALESLSRVKDRIFSVVSHDMRSPINSLISFTQLLEDSDITPEQLKRYASNLKSALGHTSAMMENLLSWASSQMQGFVPMIEKFDAQLCAQEVINGMAPVATQKGIRIENRIKSGLLCAADKNMTSLILRNLLSNAVKFTAKNGEVYIDAGLNDQQVHFMVVDYGVGLSPEQVEEINAKGFQESGKTTLGTNNERGTGIGLVLCKTFSAMMNGKISVKSEEGKGSIFTVSVASGA